MLWLSTFRNLYLFSNATHLFAHDVIIAGQAASAWKQSKTLHGVWAYFSLGFFITNLYILRFFSHSGVNSRLRFSFEALSYCGASLPSCKAIDSWTAYEIMSNQACWTHEAISFWDSTQLGIAILHQWLACDLVLHTRERLRPIATSGNSPWIKCHSNDC